MWKHCLDSLSAICVDWEKTAGFETTLRDQINIGGTIAEILLTCYLNLSGDKEVSQQTQNQKMKSSPFESGHISTPPKEVIRFQRVKDSHKKKVVVVDTSAFIAGFDPFSISQEQYSVLEVKNELIPDSLPWIRFDSAVESGKLKVMKNNLESLRKAEECSKSVGDMLRLSEVDLQVLALAIQLKDAFREPLIITDDYSIQNVADKMGLKFKSLINFGIRYQLHWIIYCPACYRKYPQNYRHKVCEICGSKLKRKSMKKTKIGKQNHF